MGWDEVARRQSGVISRAQLDEHGRSRDQIEQMRSRGALVLVARGVYLVQGAPLTYLARLWATVLCFDGVLGFATAAHLWGMLDEQPDPIEVVVSRQRHLWRQPGARTHRIDLRSWAVTERAGLPVTSRRETALDVIGRLPRGIAFTFADRALQQGWLMPRDFEDRFRRQPGRIGNQRMRLLAQSAGDGAAAHSERVLHEILRRARLVGWTANLDVWHEGRLVAVLDIAFASARVALEVDGLAFHSDADRFQRDRSRQNQLTNLGWTVLRFTWRDLVDRQGYVVATIRRALANSGSLAG